MVMPQEYSAFRANVDVANATLGEAVPLDSTIVGTTIGPDVNASGHTAFLHGSLGLGAALTITSATGATQVNLADYQLRDIGPVRWSPSGRELAVVSRRMDVPSRHDLLRITPGPEPRIDVVRSAGAGLRTVRWDSQGRLYYLRRFSIFRVDAGDAAPLTTGDELIAAPPQDGGVRPVTGFDVSPADDSIALAVYRPPMTPTHATGCTVRIVPLNGPPIDGHAFAEACWAIAWSADGKHLLLSTIDGETPRLWRLDQTGWNPVAIDTSHLIGYIVDLSFSDDGREMLFTAKGPPDKMHVIRGLDGGSKPVR